MKLTLVILLTAGVFLLPARAGDRPTSDSELQQRIDDVRKAQDALNHTENTGADTISDLQKKQNDLQKAREALEIAQRLRKEEFKKTRDLLKRRSEELKASLHRPEVYQAVVDGVRYSMLLHMPGGAPESLITKKEDAPAKPGSEKTPGSPLPAIELKQPGFQFEPVK